VRFWRSRPGGAHHGHAAVLRLVERSSGALKFLSVNSRGGGGVMPGGGGSGRRRMACLPAHGMYRLSLLPTTLLPRLPFL